MIILDYIHQGIQSAYEGVLKDIQRVMKCPIYAIILTSNNKNFVSCRRNDIGWFG